MQTNHPTPREAFEAEYGTSRNLLTPDRLTIGGNDRYAFEVATGSGIFPGTHLVGVTVVRIADDGSVSRDYDRSTSFSGDDVNQLIDQALAYAATLGEA